MHQSQRGQVTIYIIIAVVIVAFLAVVMTTRRPHSIETAPLAHEDYLAPARAIAQDCLDSSLQGVMFDLGDGGRIDYQHPVELYDGLVEAMSIDGTPHLPSMNQLASEASHLLDYEAEECILQRLETEDADRIRFPIKLGNVKTHISFAPTATLATATIPLTVTVKGQSLSTEAFSSNALVRFPTIYSSAQALVLAAQDDPARVNAELLLSLPVHVSLKTLSPTSYAYELHDPRSLLDGKPYLYRFVVAFGGVPS